MKTLSKVELIWTEGFDRFSILMPFKPSREDRKEAVAVTYAVCGLFGTLILSQFPSPINHVLIAAGNYALFMSSQESAMEARHIHVGSFFNRLEGNQKVYNKNAMLAGLITGGLSVLPLGTLLSCAASGLIGYHSTEIVNWK